MTTKNSSKTGESKASRKLASAHQLRRSGFEVPTNLKDHEVFKIAEGARVRTPKGSGVVTAQLSAYALAGDEYQVKLDNGTIVKVDVRDTEEMTTESLRHINIAAINHEGRTITQQIWTKDAAEADALLTKWMSDERWNGRICVAMVFDPATGRTSYRRHGEKLYALEVQP